MITEVGGSAQLTYPLTPATIGGWAYGGIALGTHFEIGALLSLADNLVDLSGMNLNGNPDVELAVPIKWDPFPNDWPVHLIPFAGPVLVPFSSTLLGFMTGLAVTYVPVKGIEAFGIVDLAQPLQGSLGMRFSVAPEMQLCFAADAATYSFTSSTTSYGLSASLSWTPNRK